MCSALWLNGNPGCGICTRPQRSLDCPIICGGYGVDNPIKQNTNQLSAYTFVQHFSVLIKCKHSNEYITVQKWRVLHPSTQKGRPINAKGARATGG